MADDEQAPENTHENGHENGHADAQLITQLLTQFTEAVRDLADGKRPPPSAADEEFRALRQRIDFGYRALGTLMGRVSRLDSEFDVPTFTACWDPDEPKIHLYGLPDTEPVNVTWVEVRAPATDGCRAVVETLKVYRGSRGGPTAAGAHGYRRARVEPKLINHGREIESMIGLGGPTGPLLALGPRLPALVFQNAAPAE